MIGSWVLFGQGFCRGWGQDPWTIQPDSRESTANASFRTVRGSKESCKGSLASLEEPGCIMDPPQPGLKERRARLRRGTDTFAFRGAATVLSTCRILYPRQ